MAALTAPFLAPEHCIFLHRQVSFTAPHFMALHRCLFCELTPRPSTGRIMTGIAEMPRAPHCAGVPSDAGVNEATALPVR